jgi:CheY-like chemotaxis protein
MMQHILVVDDNDISRRVVSQMLRKNGYEVTCAESGAQALQFLEQQSFDLLILDIAMPEMDGLTLLQTVRTTPQVKQVPVVMLTASAHDEDAYQAREQGANAFLSKPASSQLLIHTVRTCLE